MSDRKDLPDGIQYVSKHQVEKIYLMVYNMYPKCQVEIIYLTQNSSGAKQCLAASAVMSIF